MFGPRALATPNWVFPTRGPLPGPEAAPSRTAPPRPSPLIAVAALSLLSPFASMSLPPVLPGPVPPCHCRLDRRQLARCSLAFCRLARRLLTRSLPCHCRPTPAHPSPVSPHNRRPAIVGPCRHYLATHRLTPSPPSRPRHRPCAPTQPLAPPNVAPHDSRHCSLKARPCSPTQSQCRTRRVPHATCHVGLAHMDLLAPRSSTCGPPIFLKFCY